jgi:hypothetical protein
MNQINRRRFIEEPPICFLLPTFSTTFLLWSLFFLTLFFSYFFFQHTVNIFMGKRINAPHRIAATTVGRFNWAAC